MAAQTISNGESGSSTRAKINSVLARGTAFEEWDATGDTLPTDSDGLGSGETGTFLPGDRIIFGPGGGTIDGEFWPENTIGTVKQLNPTLTSHWRLM